MSPGLLFSLFSGNADKEHGPFKYNNNMMKISTNCSALSNQKLFLLTFLYLCILSAQSLQIYRLFCNYNYKGTGMRFKNKFNKSFLLF